MSPKILLFRIIALPAIAALVIFFGGISASMLGAVLLAFVAALLFTAVSERVFRQMLFGRFATVLGAWFVHLALETVFIAALCLGVFALFGWQANGWVAIAGGAAVWLVLTWDTLGTLLPLIALWLATRK